MHVKNRTVWSKTKLSGSANGKKLYSDWLEKR
jgi:hypothetical protein